MTQLVALEDDGQELVGKAPPGASLDEVDASDEADLVKLDRFITVINAARAGGCISVNGTFEPVERDAPPPDERDTFDFPPPRDAPHRE